MYSYKNTDNGGGRKIRVLSWETCHGSPGTCKSEGPCGRRMNGREKALEKWSHPLLRLISFLNEFCF